jgi:hypothetical protein
LEDEQKAELYADKQAVQEWKRVALEETGEALEVVVITYGGHQQLQLLYVRHVDELDCKHVLIRT